MKYLNITRKYHFTLIIDYMRVIKCYADSKFAVHPDFKSYTGGIMMWVTGATQHGSTKQKLNTKYSPEAEVVGVDNTT